MPFGREARNLGTTGFWYAGRSNWTGGEGQHKCAIDESGHDRNSIGATYVVAEAATGEEHSDLGNVDRRADGGDEGAGRGEAGDEARLVLAVVREALLSLGIRIAIAHTEVAGTKEKRYTASA